MDTCVGILFSASIRYKFLTSSPQNSVLLRAWMKFDLSRRILFSENCATDTERREDTGRTKLRLSAVTGVR